MADADSRRRLIELETRLAAYERRAQSESSANEIRTRSKLVSRSIDEVSDVPPEWAGSNASVSQDDDIDDNPLTEKITHLVLSPEGDKSLCSHP